MGTAILIGFSVVGFLAIWDSYLLEPAVANLQRWGERTRVASLIYLINCHMCKGFWLCLIGAFLVKNLLLTIPAYGVVAVCLAVMGECDE